MLRLKWLIAQFRRVQSVVVVGNFQGVTFSWFSQISLGLRNFYSAKKTIPTNK